MRNVHFIGAFVLIGAAVAFNSGCVAEAQVGGYAEVEPPVVFVEPPTLVAIEPNVWVVSDYDYAVYYVDDFYWVRRDNVWHRARSYDSGWATVEVSIVPTVILHRDHHAYVHYHGAATALTRPAPREYARSEPKRGPPDHAAAKHGGPPGHNDTPGLGNERRVQHGEHGGPAGHDDTPGLRDERRVQREERDGPPGHAVTPGQGAGNDRRDDKNDKNDNKHDKKDNPKRK